MKTGGGHMKKIIQLLAVSLAVFILMDQLLSSLQIKKLSKPYY